MLRNKKDGKIQCPVIKLFGLSAAILLQTACGGGGDSEASAIGIQDVSIAYVKRPTPRDQNGDLINNDLRRPSSFTEGGDLYLQERATSASVLKNITRRITNGLGDVKDVSLSYDGSKLLFSVMLPDPDPNDNEIPSWNLYEYDIPTDKLTQLTQLSSLTSINEDDIAPHYLPNGNIVFSSNRQIESKGIRNNEARGNFTSTDENHTNPVFLLHVRDKDDGTIKQVSFNESHDLDPIVLKDSGRVLFSRWNNMGSRNDVSLYSMNPDGTDVKMYYGSHSHNTGQDPANAVHFTKAREMDDGRLVSILRPLVTNFGGGDIVFIDAKNFADNTQPTWEQQGVVSGTAQTNFKQNITNGAGLALQGRYNAIFPMKDGSNRYLMSWSQCQILDVPTDPNSNNIPCAIASSAQLNASNVTEAPPAYGVYIVDSTTRAPLVLPQKDIIYSEIVMVYSEKVPPIINTSSQIDSDLANASLGVIHIRSVYDFDKQFMAYGAEASLTNKDNNETPAAKVTIDNIAKMADPMNTTNADERPARFIRIVKSAYIPTRDLVDISNAAYGVTPRNGMREILGYAPIEPDGSVKIKVPANVPLSLGILDKDGRRISQRHQYWFQVKPGETLECVGCHVHNTTQANMANNKPHGRISKTYSLNQGATTPAVGFPNSLNSLWAQFEETMAETRARHNDCQPTIPAATLPCDVMRPSADLIYEDVWTYDVAALRSADASFKIDYSGLPLDPNEPTNPGAGIPIPSPTSAACANDYGDTPSFTYCRTIINYEKHIEPLWSASRTYLDENNNTVTNNCITCHTATGLAHLNAGQLELTDGTSDLEANHHTSYQELLNNDNGQDNAGDDILITRDIDPPVDANMDNIPDQETVPDPAFERDPSMSTNGARNSLFMELMTGLDLNNDTNQPTDSKNHKVMLSASEQKLISEWLDIGAQYFNNPLDPAVPKN